MKIIKYIQDAIFDINCGFSWVEDSVMGQEYWEDVIKALEDMLK